MSTPKFQVYFKKLKELVNEFKLMVKNDDLHYKQKLTIPPKMHNKFSKYGTIATRLNKSKGRPRTPEIRQPSTTLSNLEFFEKSLDTFN